MKFTFDKGHLGILIWIVETRDKKQELIFNQQFFLFYFNAKMVFERYTSDKDFQDYNISLGGETLWIW